MNLSKLRRNIGQSVNLYPAVREVTADGMYNVPDRLWRFASMTEGSRREVASGAIELHEVTSDRVIRIPTRLVKEHVPRETGSGAANSDATIALKSTPILGNDGRLRFEAATKSGALLPNSADVVQLQDGTWNVRISNPHGDGRLDVTFNRLAGGRAPMSGKYLTVPPPAPRKSPHLTGTRRIHNKPEKPEPSI